MCYFCIFLHNFKYFPCIYKKPILDVVYNHTLAVRNHTCLIFCHNGKVKRLVVRDCTQYLIASSKSFLLLKSMTTNCNFKLFSTQLSFMFYNFIDLFETIQIRYLHQNKLDHHYHHYEQPKMC